MTDVKLLNPFHEITDDFEGEPGWTGLNSGEVVVDDQVWGHYVAKWRPNSNDPMFLIVTATGQSSEAKLSIVVRVRTGKPEVMDPVSSADSPWSADGVVFGEIAEPSEYDLYSLAAEALSTSASS